jgi:hypothetical protein
MASEKCRRKSPAHQFDRSPANRAGAVQDGRLAKCAPSCALGPASETHPKVCRPREFQVRKPIVRARAPSPSRVRLAPKFCHHPDCEKRRRSPPDPDTTRRPKGSGHRAGPPANAALRHRISRQPGRAVPSGDFRRLRQTDAHRWFRDRRCHRVRPRAKLRSRPRGPAAPSFPTPAPVMALPLPKPQW